MHKLKGSKGSLKSFGAIVAHPVRARCWTILNEQVASPVELSRVLKEDVSNVSYHCRALVEVGVVELVETKSVRGAVQHFYRAIQRPMSGIQETGERSLENRELFAREACQMIFADAAQALDAGTFCRRADHQVVRIPLSLDEEGWREVSAAYEDLYERIFDAQAKAVARGGDNAIRATSVGMLMERAPRDPL